MVMRTLLLLLLLLMMMMMAGSGCCRQTAADRRRQQRRDKETPSDGSDSRQRRRRRRCYVRLSRHDAWDSKRSATATAIDDDRHLRTMQYAQPKAINSLRYVITSRRNALQNSCGICRILLHPLLPILSHVGRLRPHTDTVNRV